MFFHLHKAKGTCFFICNDRVLQSAEEYADGDSIRWDTRTPILAATKEKATAASIGFSLAPARTGLAATGRQPAGVHGGAEQRPAQPILCRTARPPRSRATAGRPQKHSECRE